MADDPLTAGLAVAGAPLPWSLCAVSGCVLDAAGAPVLQVDDARDDDTLGPIAALIVFAMNWAGGYRPKAPATTS